MSFVETQTNLENKTTGKVYYITPETDTYLERYSMDNTIIGEIVAYSNDLPEPNEDYTYFIGTAYNSELQKTFVQKEPVRVTTTSELPLNSIVGLQLVADDIGNLNNYGIDGVTDLDVGDRVLVKNETDTNKNGLYQVTDLGSGGLVSVLSDPKMINTYIASSGYTGTLWSVSNETQLNTAISSCADGDIIEITTNITLTTIKTINKSIEFRGRSGINPILSSSIDPGGSGLINISGLKSDNTQNNNVYMHSFQIKLLTNVADGACISAATCNSFFNNGSTGLVFNDIDVSTTEFGIVVASNNFSITNCTFEWTPSVPSPDEHRFVGVYNVYTEGYVQNCTFNSINTSVCILLSSSQYVTTPPVRVTGHKGILYIKNCIASTVRLFFNMETFVANGLVNPVMPLHDFSLWIEGNTYGNYNAASMSLFAAANLNPLSFFDSITLLNNTAGTRISGTRKGLFSLDGSSSSPRNTGLPNHLVAQGNVSGDVGAGGLSGTYQNITTINCLMSANTSTSPFFIVPSPLITPELPGTPWILTRTSDANTTLNTTSGMFTLVLEGTENSNTYWQLLTPDPIIVNTTPQIWGLSTGGPIHAWCNITSAELGSGHICYYGTGSFNETSLGVQKYLALWITNGTLNQEIFEKGQIKLTIKYYPKFT